MKRCCGIALLAIIPSTPTMAIEPREAVAVYVEPITTVDRRFSDRLKVELSKRSGMIKPKVDIVRSREQAQYIIEVHRIKITGRRPTGHEGILSREMGPRMASVLASDRCGRLLWAKSLGERDPLFEDAHGLIDAAEKAAASFKEVLADQKSRLNRAPPCLVEGEHPGGP